LNYANAQVKGDKKEKEQLRRPQELKDRFICIYGSSLAREFLPL